MRYLLCVICSVMSFVYGHTQTINPDPTFATNGVAITPVNIGRDEIFATAVQPDGKIVAAGHSFNGSDFDFIVIRYHTTGAPDSSFGTNGIVTTPIGTGDDEAMALVIQPDGKIVAAGYTSEGNYDFAVVRYESNGDLDLSFNGTGKITINTGMAAGSPTLDICKAVALQPDGKIVAAGYTEAGSATDLAAVRLLTNGTPDASFGGGDGIVIQHVSFDDYGTGVAVQPDGKIIISGSTGTGTFRGFCLQRLNSDGSPDNSFGTFDGHVFVNSNGSPAHDEPTSLLLQPDGKILQAGKIMNKITINTGHYDFGFLRFNANGTLDNTFGAGGSVKINIGGANLSEDNVEGIALQPDGKIIAGGQSDGDFALLRLNTNGTLDNTFDGDGIVLTDLGNGHTDYAYALSIFGDRIYVGGSTNLLPNLHLALVAYKNNIPAGGPLPLTLQQFSAQKQSNTVLLQWLTEHEQDIVSFTIQRSGDGRAFTNLGSTPSLNSSVPRKSYDFADDKPLKGVNFYRLQILESDGQFKYSSIIAIKYSLVNAQLEIFPNPVSSTLRLQLPDGMNGRIQLDIIDLSGKIVQKLALDGTGNTIAISADVSQLPKGVYLVRAKSIVKQFTAKFVKE